MNLNGVNQTLLIFLPTTSPVAMQGLDAKAPWEKDLCIQLLKKQDFKSLLFVHQNHTRDAKKDYGQLLDILLDSFSRLKKLSIKSS